MPREAGQQEHECSPELRERVLGRLPFLRVLPPEERAEAGRLFHQHAFTTGEAIARAGDPASELRVVAAGQVRLVRHAANGREVLTEVLGRGETFGPLSPAPGEVLAETAEAQTDCCVLAAPATDFRAFLVAHPAAALAVLDATASHLEAARERVRRLGAESVEARVAATLLELSERQGGPGVALPLARQDLAALTGATTETVSRVTSRLRRAGLVAGGREWLAVRDAERLAAIAEGEPLD